MSEQKIGRSPFAVIAEVASVTVVTFYLYAYSFFHGFMMGIDYQYLSAFGLRDIADYLAFSLLLFVAAITLIGVMVLVLLFLIGSLIGLTSYFPSAVFRRSLSLSMAAIVIVIYFFINPVTIQTLTDRQALKWLGFAVDARAGNEITFAVIFTFLAICSVTLSIKQAGPRWLGIWVGYTFVLLAAGINAHASGFQYERRLHAEKLSYCVMTDTISVSGRLLISSDQNALIETADDELRLIPFNAIKSISNKPCLSPPTVKDANKP